MSTINASSPRSTKYELRFLHQGPNDFGIEAVERGVVESRPIRLAINESLFTDEEMVQVHAVLELLERKFDAEHQRLEDELGIQGLKAPRDKVHALVREAVEARANAQQALEAANQLLAEHARIDALKVEKVAAVDTLDKTLEQQQAMLEARSAELAHLEAVAVLKKQQLAALEADIQQSVNVAQAARQMAQAATPPATPATEPKDPGP